jgi:hypothetical protein
MKTIMTVVLTVAAIAGLAAMQDTQDQDITNLRKQLADLGLRVSRLEHAAGANPGAVDRSHGDTSADNVARSMVVVGIKPAPPRPLDQGELQDLRGDAEALQATATDHMDKEDRVAGDTYYVGGYYSDGHYGYRHTNAGRQRQEVAQRDMANRYATMASIKRQKADRLEAAANEPRQIITGHDGDVIFTLRAKHNLSEALEAISIGDTVTWAGSRVSADGDDETWEISSIRKVDL